MVDADASKKTAFKLGVTNVFAGLSVGLIAVIARLSSPYDPLEAFYYALFPIFVVSCAIGYAFLVVVVFLVKVESLRSLYKKE
jgi:hypothetical protein